MAGAALFTLRLGERNPACGSGVARGASSRALCARSGQIRGRRAGDRRRSCARARRADRTDGRDRLGADWTDLSPSLAGLPDAARRRRRRRSGDGVQRPARRFRFRARGTGPELRAPDRHRRVGGRVDGDRDLARVARGYFRFPRPFAAGRRGGSASAVPRARVCFGLRCDRIQSDAARDACGVPASAVAGRGARGPRRGGGRGLGSCESPGLSAAATRSPRARLREGWTCSSWRSCSWRASL